MIGLVLFVLFFFQLILNDFGHILTLADICGNDRVSLAKALLNLFRHERQVKILLKNINDYGIAKEGMLMQFEPQQAEMMLYQGSCGQGKTCTKALGDGS